MNKGTLFHACALLSLLFVTSTTQAYVVYDMSKVPIKVADTRYHFWNHYGSWDLGPGQRGHCPSNKKECRNVHLRAEVFDWQSWRLSTWDKLKRERCEVDIHDHENVIVMDADKGIVCRLVPAPSENKVATIKQAAKELRSDYNLSIIHAWF